MKDKDVAGILSPLLPLFDRVICTTALAAGATGVRSWRGLPERCPRSRPTIDVDRRSGGGATRGVPAGLAGRCGRLDLSGRPPAWYSSLILARHTHERARIVCGNIRCCGPPSSSRSPSCSSFSAPPSPASAQADADISQLQEPAHREPEGIRFPVKNEQGIEEMRLILTGAPDRPVRIDCDDMHLSADQMEIFDGHQVVATGQRPVRIGDQPDCVGSARVRHQDAHRHVLQRRPAPSAWPTRVDRSMFGTQEPDAMFRGEEIHKLGPDTYKIVHGASPPACSRRRAGRWSPARSR